MHLKGHTEMCSKVEQLPLGFHIQVVDDTESPMQQDLKRLCDKGYLHPRDIIDAVL